MKHRYWAIIVGGAVLLGLLAILFVLRGGKTPWLSEPPARSESLIRIASFNVEGLNDPQDDPRLTGKHDDVPSDQAHLDAIASAINTLDADILALQDVESLEALEWFNETYLSALGYDYIASIDVGHPRGAENAVLSRFPITGSWVWPTLELGGSHPSTIGDKANPWAGQPILFKRSPIMTDIRLPDGSTLTLLVVEQKGGDAFGYWREAEARMNAEICKQAGLIRPTIILGSFHCDPGDPSLQPYADAGFFDPFSTKDGSEFFATELSNDRTDFILVNRSAGRDLDRTTPFVLGGDLAESIRNGSAGMTHLPIVIGMRTRE